MTDIGHSSVINKIYKKINERLQASRFKNPRRYLANRPQMLPPMAKVIRIKVKLKPLTPHFCFSLSNIFWINRSKGR